MARHRTTPRHPIVELARSAVESFIRDDRPIDPTTLPSGLLERAGVFVTIRMHGELRGCVGTIQPVCDTLAEETIRSALLAATDDPRFPPVRVDELDHLTYSVAVLEPPEPVTGLADLDPAVYGVIVRSDRRRGLLLPDIEGVDTPEQQVEIARRKAGILPGEPVELYRFRTRRFD